MALTLPMLLSSAILVIAYYLIFSETLNRTNAAIIGAVVMVGTGLWFDFYSQEQALMAIDANTILLLAAMMMLVAMLRKTGAFELIAIFISRLAGARPKRLMIYLGLAVSLISMVLDNVTTVIVFAPLTILITRIMKLKPTPFLVAEAMLSNIGGIATLVGDPPNIMIGSAADIDFTTFLVHMFPPVAFIWVISTAFLLFVFRRDLEVPIKEIAAESLNTAHAIKDRAAFWKMIFAMGLTIVLFFIHHHFHFFPSYVAFIGLAVAMLLISPKPDKLFGEVNWSVLFFFSGLFVIVGGVEASGLLSMLGKGLATIAHDPAMLLLTCILVMWLAALLSAVVDNIPFTVTMIPIILGLESSGINVTPLWWALALGVGLGGNGTHIGATANIIVISELEKSGIANARVTPGQWFRTGAPVMIIGLLASSLIFVLFFDYFAFSRSLQ